MMFSLFLSLSYFIAMCSMNSINPESSEEVVPQGGNIKLSCKYEGSINNIQWFQQQQQRSRPEFLLLITEDGFISAEISGFSAHINKRDKRVDLEIISAKVTDSAVYYCAVRPTVTGNTTNLYKNTTSTRGSHTLLHLSVCDDVSFI
ncbi:T-cell receptor alpha chain V region PHDS58 [Solea senegalensis]|nr:T-cell receptor alpha chain V region PHDS58 [Solea senegalensis]